MRQLFKLSPRLVAMLATVLALAALQPGDLHAQALPGTGDCNMCQYDATDLENIIASCPSGYSMGANYCIIQGHYCTNVGECNSGEELHAFDVSLSGRLVVTQRTVEPKSDRPQAMPSYSRFLAVISQAGRIPCKPSAERSVYVAQTQTESALNVRLVEPTK